MWRTVLDETLEAENVPVRLVVLHASLPAASYRELIARNVGLIDRVLGVLHDRARKAVPADDLPPEATALLDRLGLPAEMAVINDADLIRHLGVMRGVGVAITRYLPVPLNCRVHLFPAAESTWPVSLAEVWRPFAPDLVTTRVPGDHYSFLRHPLVRTFAQDFADSIGVAAGSQA